MIRDAQILSARSPWPTTFCTVAPNFMVSQYEFSLCHLMPKIMRWLPCAPLYMICLILRQQKGYCSCCILFLQPFGSAVVLLSSSGGVSREFSHFVNSFSCCTIHSSSKYTELVVNGSVVLVASKRPGFASLLRTASGLWSWTLSSFCFLVFDSINLVHSVRGTEERELLRGLPADVSVRNRNNSTVGQRK